MGDLMMARWWIDETTGDIYEKNQQEGFIDAFIGAYPLAPDSSVPNRLDRTRDGRQVVVKGGAVIHFEWSFIPTGHIVDAYWTDNGTIIGGAGGLIDDGYATGALASFDDPVTWPWSGVGPTRAVGSLGDGDHVIGIDIRDGWGNGGGTFNIQLVVDSGSLRDGVWLDRSVVDEGKPRFLAFQKVRSDYFTPAVNEAITKFRFSKGLTGTIDGSNDTFTLERIPDADEIVTLVRVEPASNGVEQVEDIDYTRDDDVVTFIAGHVPTTGDKLWAGIWRGDPPLP